MRGYELTTLESEFASPEWDAELDTEWETEWETDAATERQKRLRKQRSLRKWALGRIFGLIMGGPLPMPAVPPPERPATVAEDPRRRGGHGGGSRESEAELEAIRAHPPEARLMEHLGRLATRTVDDSEAEALIGALVPLAARVVPQAEPALMRAASQLVPGLSGAARVLREHPATRPLVGRIPTVARRTAIDLGRRASLALPTPPEEAVRALARQAMRVLGEGTGQVARLLESGATRTPEQIAKDIGRRIYNALRRPGQSSGPRSGGSGELQHEVARQLMEKLRQNRSRWTRELQEAVEKEVKSWEKEAKQAKHSMQTGPRGRRR